MDEVAEDTAQDAEAEPEETERLEDDAAEAMAETEAETPLNPLAVTALASDSIPADWISWYDAENPKFQYTLESPEALFGLAYLVNAGTTFQGITIALADGVETFDLAAVPVPEDDEESGTEPALTVETTSDTNAAESSDGTETEDSAETGDSTQADESAEPEEGTECEETEENAATGDSTDGAQSPDLDESSTGETTEETEHLETGSGDAADDGSSAAVDTYDAISLDAAFLPERLLFMPVIVNLTADTDIESDSFLTPMAVDGEEEEETTEYLDWTPIGTATNCFEGIFDGGNQVINLSLDASDADHQALFGYTGTDSVIKNLTVTGSVTGGNYTAGVVAQHQGTISNVTNRVDITVTALPAEANVYVGGVAAHSTGVMEDVQNYGTVGVTAAEEPTAAFLRYIGGIVGYTTGSIQDGCNHGDISASVTKADTSTNTGAYTLYTGGIAGYSAGALRGSSNDGDITGAAIAQNSSTPTSYVGGVAAYLAGGTSDVWNSGDILGSASRATGTSAIAYAGGVFGYVSGVGEISYAYNTGAVTSEVLAGTTRSSYAGGLVARGNPTAFLSCYNAGAVREVNGGGSSASTAYSYAQAAGFLAYSATTAVRFENCYNTGVISAGSTGDFTDYGYASGFVGYVTCAVTWVNCYNAGTVTGATADGQFIGYGIAANLELAKLYNCYYNDSATAATVGDAQLMTDAEMQDPAFAQQVGFAYQARTDDFPTLHYFVDPTQDVVYFDYQESQFYGLGASYDQSDSVVRIARDGAGKVEAPAVANPFNWFSFMGWVDADGAAVDFDAEIAAETTLYASWKLNPVIIRFFYGYDDLYEDVVVEYSKTGEPLQLTRDGYELLAWYEADDTGTQTSTEAFDFANIPIYTETWLVAKWQSIAVDNTWLDSDTAKDESGNYVIKTASQLRAFAKLVNGETDSDVDPREITAVLGNDIDLYDSEENLLWRGLIGTHDVPFQGTFDGKGYTINNLNIDTKENAQGLFGYLQGATIRNLTICGTVQSDGGQYIGSLAGYVLPSDTATTVANVINEATVAGSTGTYVGGLVGYSEGNTVFQSSVNKGSVTGQSYTGGLAGMTTYTAAGETTIFSACENNGIVTGESYTGGLAGYLITAGTEKMQLTLDNCKNTGTVYGSSSYLGGLVGATSSQDNLAVFQFHNCENDAEINAEACSYVGGLVGAVGAQNGGTAEFSVSSNAEAVSGNGYVGGLVGYLYGSETAKPVISNSENNGAVTGKGSTKDDGRIGGLVGYAEDYLTVENCQNYATIRASYYYAGGLVGAAAAYLTISESENIRDEDSYIDGINFVGGLAGNCGPHATIEICSNKADITGSGNSIGGLLGGEGANNTTGGYLRVEDSSNSGKIYGSGSSSQNVGGLVGSIYTNFMGMDECVNTGRVETKGANVGGLIGGQTGSGSSEGAFTECRNEGDIEGGSPIGGLIGYNYNAMDMEYCYNTGNVTSVATSAAYTGGLIGRVAGDMDTCYNTGEIISSSTNGGSYTGGLVGYYGGGGAQQFENCYNAGSVTGAGGYIGGLIGNLNATSDASVTGTYNTGKVTGASGTASATTYYAGGLFGYVTNATVQGCYNLADVTSAGAGVAGIAGNMNSTVELSDCYSWGDVTSSYVPNTGFTGYVAGIAYLSGAGTVQNGYHYGLVSASETAGDSVTTGGVVATQNSNTDYLANTDNNYYLSDTDDHSAFFDSEISTAKPESAFLSGEVAYLLDGGDDVHRDVWTMRTDDEGNMGPRLGEPSYYNLAVGATENAVVQLKSAQDTLESDIYAGAGTTIELDIAVETYVNAEESEEQYERVLERVYAKLDADGTESEAEESDGVYLLTMPEGNAKVYADVTLSLISETDDDEDTTEEDDDVPVAVTQTKKSTGGSRDEAVPQGTGDADDNGDGSGDGGGSEGESGNSDQDGTGDGGGTEGDGQSNGITPDTPDTQTTTTQTNSAAQADAVTPEDVLARNITLAEQEEQRADDGSLEVTVQGGGGAGEEQEAAQEIVPDEIVPEERAMELLEDNRTPTQSVINPVAILLIIIAIAAILVISGVFNYRRKMRQGK
ncbi:MAG: hypothetical protein LUG13_04380 [Oscillospiraceae bacterium]|nr:hypothetical protein [Oscillospiraceae bacterium]